MTLDPRTIMFVTAFMGPVLAMVLLSMRRTYPSAIHGLGWWAQGTWLIFAGVLLVAARGWIDGFLSTVVGNALVIIGTWQWQVGTNSFLGLRPYRRTWLALVTLSIGAISWFYAVQPNFEMRTAVIGATMVALLTVHATKLLRQNRYQYAARFVSVALLASVVGWLVRLAGVMGGMLGSDLFAQSSFNALVNSVQTVAQLLVLVGFVLLASERVRHDFEMLATLDSLTGALMRRAWNIAAQTEVDRSRRHQRALSLIAMDLDHFKQINDSLGHAVGDQVLVHFVSMVGQHLRGHDQLGRLGGEEFVLLLPETTLEDAVLVAERIRAATEILQVPCAFTVSMGVAHLAAGDDSLESLLERADAAMYRAKARGRNCVERETQVDGRTPLPPEEPPIKSALRRA